MTKDYEYARDQMSLKALRMLDQVGNERATQHFLGWIDALTVAVFHANGGARAIGLAVDNTQPKPDFAPAA